MLAHLCVVLRGSDCLLFDFDTFAGLVQRAYDGEPYTLEQVLSVFKYYFWRYEETFGHPHPHIRMEQIRRIIQIMPFIDRDSIGGSIYDIEPENYQEMIDQHFKTAYKNCDYNINHFFSGQIRELRLYETCY